MQRFIRAIPSATKRLALLRVYASQPSIRETGFHCSRAILASASSTSSSTSFWDKVKEKLFPDNVHENEAFTAEIRRLVKCAASDDEKLNRHAAIEMAKWSTIDPSGRVQMNIGMISSNRVRMVREGAIPHLMKLRNSENNKTRENAVKALSNLKIHDEVSVKTALEGGCAPALVALIATENEPSTQLYGLDCVESVLSHDPEGDYRKKLEDSDLKSTLESVLQAIETEKEIEGVEEDLELEKAAKRVLEMLE